MRVERVVARAFGPLDEQTLEFGPGMSVVVGPNEAGKSTWHAATRLALTGVRRGRGRATAADAAVEARHRPWDAPDRWEVEARLALADGREIDISQDLGAKVACRAVDVALGRDVSDEIMDGTPDASRWLGLDRDSFAATVSVSQSQILGVASADSAELLQEHMQRAAATRGTDATAAEAIERLVEFRRTAVGADTTAARGPLRAAKGRLAECGAALEEARTRHADYLDRSAAAETAGQAVAAARRRLAVADAAVAREAAGRAAERLRRTEELAGRHAAQPMGLPARAEQADAVAAAIDGWARRPKPIELAGPGADELARRLDEIPALPSGDIRPEPGVVAAMRELDLSEERLRDHAAQRPGADPVRPTPSAPPPTFGGPLLVLAAFMAIAGLALVALGAVPAGVASLLVAVAAAGGSWSRGAGARRAVLEATADADARARMTAERLEAWEQRGRALAASRSRALEILSAELARRGASAAPDPRSAAAAYLRGCEERAEIAAAASGRESLERELAARRAAEQTGREAAAAARAAEDAVRAAAHVVGTAAGADASVQELIEGLRAWQRDRAAQARSSEAAIAEWQELRALLGDGTLEDLRAEAATRAQRSAQLSSSLPSASLDGTTQPSEAELAAIRAELDAARSSAASIAGGLQVIRDSLPDVAEAEEALAGATAELDRVMALANVLDTTLELLRSAQDRIHRDLAPILADAIRRWLPTVSGGAYAEVSVDPANLSVRVKEATTGQWRDAWLLSEGTREQIYLLLRVAMAEHLVRPGEVAPLLLDEVTAQSDGRRKRELLDVLHHLSHERQVILFSHDDDVAGWARTALEEPRDRLIELPDPRMRDGGATRPGGQDRADARAPLPVG